MPNFLLPAFFEIRTNFWCQFHQHLRTPKLGLIKVVLDSRGKNTIQCNVYSLILKLHEAKKVETSLSVQNCLSMIYQVLEIFACAVCCADPKGGGKYGG